MNITAKELVKKLNIGWNLGNTLDSVVKGLDINEAPIKWETGWGNVETTQALFDTLINKGFNLIRIPTSWNDHIDFNNGYKINKDWMNRVKEVVDYAYKNNDTYVILNIHHESWNFPYYDNEEKCHEILKAVWLQIADEFKDYDEHLIFEGMNEPRKIGTPVEWTGGDEEGWAMVNSFNKVFINTIRSSSGNNPDRILMIPGYAANCWEAMKHIDIPQNDDKIIISVHAYEPYHFALDKEGEGIWNNNTTPIDLIMNNLNDLFISKGIPVILGEFGAMYKPAPNNDVERKAWATYYVKKAKSIGVPCVWWDNGLFDGAGECFGLINRTTLDWKYPEVVEGLFNGLK